MPAKVPIFLRIRTGLPIDMDLDPSITVGEAKAIIQKRCDNLLPANCFTSGECNLKIMSKVLEDDAKTLADYGLKRLSKVEVLWTKKDPAKKPAVETASLARSSNPACCLASLSLVPLSVVSTER